MKHTWATLSVEYDAYQLQVAGRIDLISVDLHLVGYDYIAVSHPGGSLILPGRVIKHRLTELLKSIQRHILADSRGIQKNYLHTNVFLIFSKFKKYSTFV